MAIVMSLSFFNLDLHVSVIADVRTIFAALGHRVTDWTLSGHAWVFGRRPAPAERYKFNMTNSPSPALSSTT